MRINTPTQESTPVEKRQYLKPSFKREMVRHFQKGGIDIDSLFNAKPALKKVYGEHGEKLKVKADTNFKPYEIGYGAIEFYDPEKDTVRYNLPKNDYNYPNPNPGGYGILYNPNQVTRKDGRKVKVTNEDIYLDLLHGMPADSMYNALRNEFSSQAIKDRGGDIKWDWKNKQAKGDTIDGFKAYERNYVDGLIRSELTSPIEDGDYSEERKYNSPQMKTIAKKMQRYMSGDKSQGLQLTKPKYQKGGEIEPQYVSPGEPALSQEKKLYPIFKRASDSTGYPIDFLQRVAFKESSFRPKVKASDKRGTGLIQFDKTTAKRFGVKDKTDTLGSLIGFTKELDQYAKEAGGNYEHALARHHGASQYKTNPKRYREGKYKDYYDFILPSLNKAFVERKNVEDYQVPQRERKDNLRDITTQYEYNKIMKQIKKPVKK